MVHEGDTLRDLKLDEDRQVFIDDTNDLANTDGLETVKQSVMLHCGETLRPLVGGPITAKKIQKAESAIQQALENDPQVNSVERVEINGIDKDNNSVDVTVTTDVEHEFALEDIL